MLAGCGDGKLNQQATEESLPINAQLATRGDGDEDFRRKWRIYVRRRKRSEDRLENSGTGAMASVGDADHDQVV